MSKYGLKPKGDYDQLWQVAVIAVPPLQSKYGLKPKGDYDACLVFCCTWQAFFVSKYGLKPKGDYDSTGQYSSSIRARKVQIWTEAERRL